MEKVLRVKRAKPGDKVRNIYTKEEGVVVSTDNIWGLVQVRWDNRTATGIAESALVIVNG